MADGDPISTSTVPGRPRVQPDGAIAQCQVESEHPDDGRFGRNALRATDDARIVSPGETPGQYAPRMVGFRVSYVMR